MIQQINPIIAYHNAWIQYVIDVIWYIIKHLNAYGKKLQKMAKNMYIEMRIILVGLNWSITKYVITHKNNRKKRVISAQKIFIHEPRSFT